MFVEARDYLLDFEELREDLKAGRGGLMPGRELGTIDLDANCWIE